jgi:hypothetical protein
MVKSGLSRTAWSESSERALVLFFVSAQDINLKDVCACAPVLDTARIKKDISTTNVLIAIFSANNRDRHIIMRWENENEDER